ncbi:hypothetical protein [Variovorax sp. PAMC 28711]|uniref:hypothetical protein n=1 Tax=Variovorax sp. PAMC 28711 TaxID=1795631 RepID=UPI00078EEC9F|nr:hypothetical protein [Variovorax sp. PAMC 28711]AMM23014.1 hypothetical protein AX767_00420 [Variovorax sp. PAMC 28711]
MQHELGLRPDMLMIDPTLIAKQPTMSKALALCQSLSGHDDKHFIGATGIVKDSAQWSRIMNAGQHNFPHDKLNLFMDLAGNEAPLLWMVHQRGYDLDSLRKRETQIEMALRMAQEQIHQLRHDKRVLTEALRGITS